MYFLEAKGEERKIEAASWMKKMTEYLGKLKKLITKNIANTVDVVFFFSEWNNYLEDFSGIKRKSNILKVKKLGKT